MSQPQASGRRPWLRARIPELAIVVFAIALRGSLARTYDVSLGYDYPAHVQFMRYLLEHHAIPPYDLNFSTYNPALYYALAAVLLKVGFTLQAIGVVSIICSSLQVLLVWLGVELYLRESRLARVLTLTLAAIIPAGVHVAGLLSNQAFSDLFCVGAILLLPQVMVRRGRDALRYGAAAGVCLGIALLTKVTGATVLGAFVIAVALTIARARVGTDVARALLPGAAVLLAVVTVLAGWHYVRHRILYGKFVVVAYDPYLEIDPIFKIPYLDRRTLGFVASWDDTIYRQPFWASAVKPYSHFWPTLVATTFSDYYNFAFVPPPAPGTPTVQINSRPMRAAAILPARGSAVGGTALALLAAVAGVVTARRFWRRGDDGRLVLLLVAGCAVAGQLHFAIRFPADIAGPVKGSYLQFAAPIYSALAALAIAALWNRRGLAARSLALAGMAAIALVAAYTIYARVVVPLAS